MPGTFNFVIVKAFVVVGRIWGKAGARQGRGPCKSGAVGGRETQKNNQAHPVPRHPPLPPQVTAKREVRGQEQSSGLGVGRLASALGSHSCVILEKSTNPSGLSCKRRVLDSQTDPVKVAR